MLLAIGISNIDCFIISYAYYCERGSIIRESKGKDECLIVLQFPEVM